MGVGRGDVCAPKDILRGMMEMCILKLNESMLACGMVRRDGFGS